MNNFPLTNRALGTIGLLGAPLMLIGMFLPALYPALAKTAWDGLSGLAFMLTWMGSLVGLIRLNATGSSSFGRFIIRANLVTLTLANVWNIYQAIEPNANTTLYWILDAFWPISMVTMLLVGSTVARVGILHGWRRYVPLAVGLWLPFTALTGQLLGQIEPIVGLERAPDAMQFTMLISGIYATLCWGLMGYAVLTTRQPAPVDRVEAILV